MGDDREPASTNLEERVMELELRSEFHNKEIGELDDVLREYALRVEKLERELRDLRAQLTALSPGDALTLGDPSVLES
jgi:uncharacterized coiled-coil protein SlyX